MKALLFTLSIFISTVLFAQNKDLSSTIIDFKTIERNKKSVVFSEITSEFTSSFVISANNGNSKEYSRCKWESTLTYNEMTSFIEQLSLIDIKKERIIEYDNFILKVKRNKVRIQFVNSKCLQEHKTHYFQESCSRAFLFVLTNVQKHQLIAEMENILLDQRQVRK